MIRITLFLLAWPVFFQMVKAEDLNSAISLYYEARFDSSAGDLEKCLSGDGLKRRDSTIIFQYLGMNSVRMGLDSAADAWFYRLLEVDSLWQFPQNENPEILTAFSHSQRRWVNKGKTAPLTVSIAPRDSAFFPSRNLPQTQTLPIPLSLPALPRMTLAYGALPAGTGWIARQRPKTGIVYGALQAGGIILSLYASLRQDNIAEDAYGIRSDEFHTAQKWQTVQRISLTAAAGTYLVSVLTSLQGDE